MVHVQIVEAVGADRKKAVHAINKFFVDRFWDSILAIPAYQKVSVSVINLIGSRVIKDLIQIHSLNFNISENV